jgi:hypothetical protein
MSATTYEHLCGDLHRHADGLTHSHPHSGPHTHEADHDHHAGHAHTHGLIDPTIQRSREGIRAVVLSLLILGLAAALRYSPI